MPSFSVPPRRSILSAFWARELYPRLFPASAEPVRFPHGRWIIQAVRCRNRARTGLGGGLVLVLKRGDTRARVKLRAPWNETRIACALERLRRELEGA